MYYVASEWSRQLHSTRGYPYIYRLSSLHSMFEPLIGLNFVNNRWSLLLLCLITQTPIKPFARWLRGINIIVLDHPLKLGILYIRLETWRVFGWPRRVRKPWTCWTLLSNTKVGQRIRSLTLIIPLETLLTFFFANNSNKVPRLIGSWDYVPEMFYF